MTCQDILYKYKVYVYMYFICKRLINSISWSSLEDCAELLLNCLFCRFYDLFLMLPETCERAANRICPAYMYFSTTAEGARSSNCKCNCNFDCGLMDACHDTGECIELAMEISEVCYR